MLRGVETANYVAESCNTRLMKDWRSLLSLKCLIIWWLV